MCCVLGERSCSPSLSLHHSLFLYLCLRQTWLLRHMEGRGRWTAFFLLPFLSSFLLLFFTPPPFHIHSDSADDLWDRLAVDGYSISTLSVDNYIKQRATPHDLLYASKQLFSWFPPLDLLSLITSPLTPWPCRKIMIRCSPSFKLVCFGLWCISESTQSNDSALQCVLYGKKID